MGGKLRLRCDRWFNGIGHRTVVAFHDLKALQSEASVLRGDSMSETSPSTSADGLQFATVESGDLQSSANTLVKNCAVCSRPIESTYYAVGQQVVCPTCCAQISTPTGNSRLVRFVMASLLGIGGGLLGAVVWFAVRRLANIEAGIVAILVGFLVGKAVHKGSQGRGGIGYQILAVVITYCCIAANYMPDIVEAMFTDVREQRAIDAKADADDPTAATVFENKDGTGAVPDARKPRSDVGIGAAAAAAALIFVFAFAISLALPFLQGAAEPDRLADYWLCSMGGVEAKRPAATCD